MAVFNAYLVRETITTTTANGPDEQPTVTTELRDTVLRYTAETKAAKLAKAMQIRATSELQPVKILDIVGESTVVKNEPLGAVWMGKDLPWCLRFVRMLRAGIDDVLANEVQAAIDAYVASGA